MTHRRRAKCFRGRAGSAAAVVELAVVLPLILTLLFGIIEFGWVLMVCQTLTTAAREGCRTAVLPGSLDSDIQTRVNKVIQSSGLPQGQYSIVVTHATVIDPTETVTVKIPYQAVSLVGKYFGLNNNFSLKGFCAMRKEGL